MSDHKIDPILEGFDPDFANRGIASKFSRGSLPVQIVDRRSNGKILLAGFVFWEEKKKFQLVQLLESGNRDPEFGVNGIVARSFKDGFDASIHGARLLDDGKIMLVGVHHETPLQQLAFAKFLENGSLDETFGDGGIVITPTPSSMPTDLTPPSEEIHNGPRTNIAIAPDGKILMATGPIVSRYLSNGHADFEFKTKLRSINALGVSANGSITVVGSGYPNRGTIARFNPDGTPDQNFGDAGYSSIDIPDALSTLSGLVLRDDGSSFVTGSKSTSPVDPARTGERGILSAFNANGRPNLVFNGGQPLITELPQGQACRWSDIDSDSANGRLVVVGSVGLKDGESSLIARYTLEGKIDTTFGNRGFRVTKIGTTREELLSLQVQPNGKIIASGYCTFETDPATVVRYQG